MKDNKIIKSISRMANGHKRISLNPKIAGKVRLLIEGQIHYRDTLESARWLAHRLAQKILLKRQQRRASPFHSTKDEQEWIEYQMIVEDIPVSELPEIGSFENEVRRMELAEKRRKGEIPRVIIERYPQGKRVHNYGGIQGGLPETDRRKF